MTSVPHRTFPYSWVKNLEPVNGKHVLILLDITESPDQVIFCYLILFSYPFVCYPTQLPLL